MEEQRKAGKSWEHLPREWHQVDMGGGGWLVPDSKYVPESEFLTGQAEYFRSCVNILGLA